MQTVRIRLDLAYDGTDFSGWAIQPDRRTVEGTLADALSTLMRSAEPVRLTVAGRTDAGVHALGQVAHCDLNSADWQALHDRSGRPPGQVARTRLNGLLPNDVRIHRVQVAPAGFDARFSALSRRYRYRIADDVARHDPVRRHDTVDVRGELDVDAMNAAARQLVGLHDFAAFCRRREGATTIRTLLQYQWSRDREGVVTARVEADAFCHSMVRALVGALVPVGHGQRSQAFPLEVLSGGVRVPTVKVMPPQGLSLQHVSYPDDAHLAQRAEQARTRRDLPEGTS